LQFAEVYVSLSRKHRHHPPKVQGEFLVLRGYRLYKDFAMFGQGQNFEAPVPLFLLA
jgi:hypothetical protein